jgi:putative hemolysin
MTPRADIVALRLEAPPAENLRIVRREGYTRLPVCRGSLSEVVGILDTLDLLDPALEDRPLELESHLRAPLWVPETIHVIRLLELFKQNKEHLALVVDEYGELEGLVTMTDVLEAIVGEVPEPGAADSPEIVRRDDGSLLVDGGASLASLRGALSRPLELPEDEANTYQTVGGLVMARLGRVPRAGDGFDFAQLRFEVLDMDRRRVDKVLVAPQRAPDGG